MLVWHALWSPTLGVSLWAEDSDRLTAVIGDAPAAGPPDADPRQAAGRPLPHPFAAEPAWLRAALPGLGDAVGELTLLLLPGTTVPAPSPESAAALPAHSAPVGHAPARLGCWRVPVLVLEPGAVVGVVRAVGWGPAGECVPGASARFLGEVVGLACGLAAGGRVLPALVEEPTGPAARWLPVPDDAAAERVRRLAAVLPPVLCAERPTRAGADLERERGRAGRRPGEVLTDLLGFLVDGIARDALVSCSLLPRGRVAGEDRATAAWLAAVTSEDGTVDEDADPAGFRLGPEDLDRLAEELRWWRRSAVGAAGAARTCFRLLPPEEVERVAEAADGPPPDGAPDGWAPGDGQDAPVEVIDRGGGGWRLEVLFQSADDPSLLLGAEEVWRSEGSMLLAGQRAGVAWRQLHGDLVRAAGLWTELTGALVSVPPGAVSLDTAGAYRFLREAAPRLAAAGFGVLTPTWWHQPPPGLGLALSADPLDDEEEPAGRGYLGLAALLDVRWEAALGGERISRAELEALARAKLPLVRVRGRWVEVDRDVAGRALAFLDRQAETPPGGVELLRAALGEPPADGLPVVDVDAGGWLGDLLGGTAEQRLEPAGTPAGFHGQLRPYQERGLAWLSFLERVGLGGCLADDMGLGKTVQLLALLAAERAAISTSMEKRRAGPGASSPGPTLLVCPVSVVGNWHREAERFTPGLSVHVHHGRERLAGEELAKTLAASDLVVTTYALAVRDWEALAAVDWHRVVLDEAQQVKNPATKQAKAVRSLPARQRLALTGTPVENRLAELWSVMDFCNPGLLGSASDFRTRFAMPVERRGDEEAAGRLRRLTRPFVLRRRKTDPAIAPDLPAKQEMRVWCTLTREQASLYRAVTDDLLTQVEAPQGLARRSRILTAMLKLKQVCNHPANLVDAPGRLAGRSGKLTLLEEVLAEALAAGDKALVFTQFAAFGHRLREHLAGRLGAEVCYLHGGTPKQTRDELVERFQDPDGPPVFLLSLKAGGTGLNLTAASHVVHFDRWWNPAVEDQATDRAFRIGQRRDVQVRKLVCVGTLEERVDRMIEDKKALAERVVGDGEAWLTELSTEELREVVRLRDEAVTG